MIRTHAQLKKALDKVFSTYIRMSHATKQGVVKCVTCGKIDHWKQMDCGHWSSRQYLSTRYDERNVAPQCKSCNRFHEGRKDDFTIYLKNKYGVEILDELTTKKHEPTFNFPFEEKISYYKKAIKELDVS